MHPRAASATVAPRAGSGGPGGRPAWSPPAVAWPLIVGVAAVATLYEPFSWPMRVSVALPSLVVVLLALRRGWHRAIIRVDWARQAVDQVPSGARWLGLAVWALLLAALAVFQLALFTSNPRDVYPTLSSLANATFDAQWVRIAAFTVWLWVGWYLVER